MRERINADIYRAVSTALMTKVNDPALADASVLRTELSADGSVCDIFVTNHLDDFKKASGFFRTEIAKAVNLRRVPKLSFIMDRGQSNAERVEMLLSRIHGGTK
jgi:ribosome-binding factor A